MEFKYPIDYSIELHHILTSNPEKFASFADEQATLLSDGRGIARELINTHRIYHHEYINSRRPNQRLYPVGDVVFVRRSVKSVKKRGLVGKLMNAFTGPWRILSKLHGSSYEVEHVQTHRVTKRYAAHLSPFPLEMIPFKPVDGPDNRYGQIYTPMRANLYSDAGIKGLEPYRAVQTFRFF